MQPSEPEQVFVELEWYDGPRAGIANVNGVAHRFTSNFDENEDEYTGTFNVWPINEPDFAREIEQWRIFVDWNKQYELGTTDTSTHPGVGGINARWDELDAMLENSRTSIPSSVRVAKAIISPLEEQSRYEYSGPDYMLMWQFLPE